MNIELELSRRLSEWLSSRRKVMDWVARHEDSNPDAEVAQYVELRDHSYDCEWNLLSLGARKELWEKLLENESDMDREEAMDLREMVPDLELVSGKQRAVEDGLYVSSWLFIPYAAWVGLPRASVWAHPEDHARPMLDRVMGMFRDAAQTIIPQSISEEQQGSGKSFKATFQFVPGMDADRLRDFMLPPGSVEDWPEQDKDALDFRPDPTSPTRAGCVGVYLAAESYRTLALVRDIVRDMAMVIAKENQGPHLKVGPLLSRQSAISTAELMRWELWAERIAGLPLDEAANRRHITFTVERKNGKPCRLLAHVADLGGEDVWASEAFVCRVEDHDMIHHALHPFIECSRTDTTWSMQQIDLPAET